MAVACTQAAVEVARPDARLLERVQSLKLPNKQVGRVGRLQMLSVARRRQRAGVSGGQAAANTPTL